MTETTIAEYTARYEAILWLFNLTRKVHLEITYDLLNRCTRLEAKLSRIDALLARVDNENVTEM